jgi:hypothetical protein
MEESKNDSTASENDVHGIWHAIKMSNRGQKHPLNELCGLQKNVKCVLEASLLFSDQHLIVLLLKPTGMQIFAFTFLR